MNNLQNKDKNILLELDYNSRQPNKQIAKTLKLSQDIVNYRIKKLEEKKYIKQFITVIDFTKLGYCGFRTYIKLINTNPELDKQIIAYLKKEKTTTYLAEIEGTYNIAFVTFVKTPAEFYKIYSDFKEHFRKYIQKDKITIYTEIKHLGRKYLNEKKKISKKEDKPQEYHPDQQDIQILDIISVNSRMSLRELSKKTQIPISTTVNRIKKLQKSGIIAYYGIVFNFEKIKYNYIRIDLNVNDTKKISVIKEFAGKHPNIIYTIQTIGGADIELIFEIESTEKCYEEINRLRSIVPEITDWEMILTRRQHKYQYFA